MHSLVLETIQKTLFLIGKDNIFFAFIDYLGSPILTFTIIIAIALFLNKFLPKVFKVISGGRVLPPKTENCNNT